ncbi:MAG TPA: carboxypeptidase regulatory-like domain-containing protein [Polyangiaceae bacterium]|nr:carboxypeptidase regulatory-like domain-containing protein [Polyangiaceae bacterium]
MSVAVGLALALAAALLFWRARAPSPVAGPAAGSSAPPMRPAEVARAPSRAPPLPRTALFEADVERGDDAPGSLAGRVVSASDGRGLAGATLTFVGSGGATTVAAGSEGAFRFAPGGAGRYELASASAPGHEPRTPDTLPPVVLFAAPGEHLRGVVIALEPLLAVGGVVLSPEGAPVPGARVRASSAGGGAPASAEGDARGRFRIEAAEGSWLEASHAAYAPAYAPLDPAARFGRDVVLKLRPRADAGAAAGVSGVVLDERGEPVADAAVRADPRSDNPAAPEARARPPGQAFTGEDGRFSMPELEAGLYRVAAWREGVEGASLDGVAAGSHDVRLVVAGGGAVRGRVFDRASGEPIAAFTLGLWRREGPLERAPAAHLTVFDGGGRFEIRGVRAGEYALRVVARGRAPSPELPVSLGPGPGAEARVEVGLSRGARVHGVVRSAASGRPIAGARVEAEGGPVPGGFQLADEATTDAAGRFSLGGMAEGLRSIVASAPGHHGRVLSGLGVGAAGDVGPLDVALRPTAPGEQPSLELTGIGAVLAPRGDVLVVGEVVRGGGAAEAGIAPGDEIVSVEGAEVAALGFEGAVQRIRGPEGSAVRLGVRRAGAVTELSVVRRRVAG